MSEFINPEKGYTKKNARRLHPLDERSGKIRSPTIRKLAGDGRTFTPTEKVRRNKLMKQFARMGRKGYELSGASPEFKAGYELMECSFCHFRLKDGGSDFCSRCTPEYRAEETNRAKAEPSSTAEAKNAPTHSNVLPFKRSA